MNEPWASPSVDAGLTVSRSPRVVEKSWPIQSRHSRVPMTIASHIHQATSGCDSTRYGIFFSGCLGYASLARITVWDSGALTLEPEGAILATASAALHEKRSTKMTVVAVVCAAVAIASSIGESMAAEEAYGEEDEPP